MFNKDERPNFSSPDILKRPYLNNGDGKIIREAKKKSWQNYVSKLNTSSNIKTVWLMIRKISGIPMQLHGI